MIGCDLLSAVSVFAVLLAMVFATWKAVFFATLVSSILSQFSQPAGMKLFKLHVPEEWLQMGISLYQTMFAVFMMLGPVIGTFVYEQYGIQTAIVMMGAAFLLSAGALVFLPPDRVEPGERNTTLREEMANGFRYVLSNRTLTVLGACFALAGLALGLIQPMAVFLVTERLQMAKENLQWLMAANGAAMIVGGAVAIGLAKKLSPQNMLMLGMFVVAAGTSVSGFSTSLWLTLLAQAAIGLMLPFIHTGINTMILLSTETDFVGRVNGILTPLFMGAMIVTMSVCGFLKEWFSLVALFQASAVLFVIGGLVLLRGRRWVARPNAPVAD